jgi:hypothetical protein
MKNTLYIFNSSNGGYKIHFVGKLVLVSITVIGIHNFKTSCMGHIYIYIYICTCDERNNTQNVQSEEI